MESGAKTLFGRDNELNILRRELDNVVKNGCNIIFVVGEGGIGKTSLIKEFGKYITKNGFEFWVASCGENVSEPYYPIKQILKSIGNSYDIMEEPYLLALPTNLMRNEITFRTQRYSIWWNTAKWIKRMALEKPSVIFLDDFQYADAATIQLLYFLKNNLKDVPVLFICAYRPEGLEKNDFLKEIILRMKREHSYNEIILSPLGDEAIHKMLCEMLNTDEIPEEFVEIVKEKSQGNPLFIKELINQMIKDGILNPQEHKYPTSGEMINIPDLIEDIVKRRIESLDDVSQRVLQLGSVIGEVVPYAILADASGMDEESLLESIEELTSSGLWMENPTDETFKFAEKLIREVGYETIPPKLRKEMHGAVAESMVKIYSENIDSYLSEIAYHYEIAGSKSLAVKFYCKAGERAEKEFAHEDAVRMYKNALKLCEDGEIKCSILEKIGDALKIMSKYDDAMKYYQQVLEISEKNEIKMKIYAKMAEIFTKTGKYEDAIKLVERGLSLSKEHKENICILLDTLGGIYLKKGDYSKAREIFMKCKKIAEEIGDKDKLAQAYHSLGSVAIFQGNYKESIECFTKAIEIREELKDYIGLASSYNNLGIAYHEMGNITNALSCYEKSLKLDEKIGDKYRLQATLDNLANIYLQMGELKKGLNYCERSLEISEEIGYKEGSGVSLITLGNIKILLGEFDDAKKCFEESLRIYENIGNKYGIALSTINLADVFRIKGERNSALEYYQKAKSICEEIGDRYLMIYVLKDFGEIYAEEGKTEMAIDLINRAVKISQEIDTKLEEARCYLSLAKIFKNIGKFNEAIDYLKRCMEISEKIYNFVELPEIYYHYASVLTEIGEITEAKKILEKALEMATNMGLPLATKMIKEELQILEEKS